MRDFRPVFYIIGILLCIESITMLIPMIVDLIFQNNDWLKNNQVEYDNIKIHPATVLNLECLSFLLIICIIHPDEGILAFLSLINC